MVQTPTLTCLHHLSVKKRILAGNANRELKPVTRLHRSIQMAHDVLV